MSSTIVLRETNSAEEWLQVNADGTLTHHIENSGWSMARSGPLAREKVMTAHDAKARWPSFADKIDAALLQVAAEK